jgi:hypothetical protein
VHNKELHDPWYLSDMIRVIKSRRTCAKDGGEEKYVHGFGGEI